MRQLKTAGRPGGGRPTVPATRPKANRRSVSRRGARPTRFVVDMAVGSGTGTASFTEAGGIDWQ